MIKCDHKSVGVLVKNDVGLLLIERKKWPYGFAPPAGHVDAHPTWEEAAESELFEEVGLCSTQLTLVVEGRRTNPCRRPEGTWHYWKIYRAITTGKIKPSASEVKRAIWCSEHQLNELAQRTIGYVSGAVTEENWILRPGLEPVWFEWLKLTGDLAA
jgi:ADP-ribose pyrophosphatase YjhB (NUDIX family)